MPTIGPLEIVIVLVIALVIFGPKKLPDLGRSVGQGLREFKGSVTGESDSPAGKRPRLESKLDRSSAEPSDVAAAPDPVTPEGT